MGMEDMIKAILGASGASQTGASSGQSQSAGQTGDALGDILGAILGGAGQESSAAAGGQQQSSAGGLGDILGAILGVQARKRAAAAALAAEQRGRPGRHPGRDPGGAGQESSTSQQSSAGGLGDILGAILGSGGALDSAGATTDSGALNIETLFAPIINGLAAKLGLPPALAQAVVAFVVSKLLTGQTASAQQTQQAQGGGLNLDGLLDQMRSDQGVSSSYLKRTGMAQELAQQAGLDPKTAAKSLQEVFNMLSGHSPVG